MSRWDLDRLADIPDQDRQQLQAEALLAYAERRRRDVEQSLRALGWLARRRIDPAELAARYDAQHLLGYDVCRMAAPHSDPEEGIWDGEPGTGCRHCGAGHLVDHDQAAAVPTLADRLATLRLRRRSL